MIRRVLVFPLLLPIWLYRRVVSPLLPPSCRFMPTCSTYAEEALLTWGPIKGTWLAMRRILRCHPLCPGGEDPVPPRTPRPD